MDKHEHLAEAESALAAAGGFPPGNQAPLGLCARAIAHALTALLADALEPPAPRPAPEDLVWNVIVRVRENRNVSSAQTAIDALKGSLTAAGFVPMDDPGQDYHDARPAGGGTWDTTVSVVDCLLAPSGDAARSQLLSALGDAGFYSIDPRIRPRDWFRSEDLPA
jgi:hypothetical protein